MRALRVDATVLAWVEQQPEGRVHSVFARACNLAWGDRLIAVVHPEQGMVPGGIVVEATAPPWDFRPGEPVAWDGGRRRLAGARTAIDLAGAAVWENRPALPAIAGEADLLERLDLVTGLIQAEGRGELARLLTGGSPAPAGGSGLSWSQYAWVPIAEVLRHLAAGDGVRAAHPLPSLIGLGEGLTPSGDDFVVGLLAALHYGREGLDPSQAEAGRRLAREAARLAPGTTPVSASYIRQAAAGRFSEQLEAAALAILSPEGEGVAEAARRLIQTGHSSGTDSLVGLVLGIRAIFLKGHIPGGCRSEHSRHRSGWQCDPAGRPEGDI